MLLRHADGRWLYHPMDGRAPVVSGCGEVRLERDAHWRFAGIGDVDGDGRDDIVLRHTDGGWLGYLMDGRTVRESASLQGLPADPSWKLAGLGDLDGDGRTDVVLRHVEGRWRHAPLDGFGVASAGVGALDLLHLNAAYRDKVIEHWAHVTGGRSSITTSVPVTAERPFAVSRSGESVSTTTLATRSWDVRRSSSWPRCAVPPGRVANTAGHAHGDRSSCVHGLPAAIPELVGSRESHQ